MAQFGRTATLVAINRETKRKITINCGLSKDLVNGVRVSFNIEKSRVALNTAEIGIYNIGSETIDFLSNIKVDIEFYAGYIDYSNLIFKGQITHVKNERFAPDDVTTIFSSSGLTSAKESYTSRLIKAGSTTTDVVKELLKDVLDLKSGFIDKLDDCKTWVRSQTLSGETMDILKRLGDECDFNVNINDDKIEIYKKLYKPTGSNLIVINSETGLLGIPSSTAIGVDFTAMLNPDLVPFKGVNIESKSFSLGFANPTYARNIKVFKDGRYEIISVSFVGDTDGSDWVAKCKTEIWGGV